MTTERQCLKCKEWQPADHFAYNGKTKFCDNCRWEGLTYRDLRQSHAISNRESMRRKRRKEQLVQLPLWA